MVDINIREELSQIEPNLMLADGFDEAIIGVDTNNEHVIYSVETMVSILVTRDGMTEEDAMDYLGYNVFSTYVGKFTPIYVQSLCEKYS